MDKVKKVEDKSVYFSAKEASVGRKLAREGRGGVRIGMEIGVEGNRLLRVEAGTKNE